MKIILTDDSIPFFIYLDLDTIERFRYTNFHSSLEKGERTFLLSFQKDFRAEGAEHDTVNLKFHPMLGMSVRTYLPVFG